MSWITVTALVIIVSFVCAFGLSEWVALRRRGRPRGDDTSAMG